MEVCICEDVWMWMCLCVRGSGCVVCLCSYCVLFQDECKVGWPGTKARVILLFQKLLLMLKKKDDKCYTYKAHIMVSCVGTSHHPNTSW